MDIKTLDDTYRQQMRDLIDKYGDFIFVPREERDLLAERHRAQTILLMNQGEDVGKTLRFYGVAHSVIQEFVDEDALNVPKKVKRSDKYQSIVDWCNEHPYEQVTANQIAEIGEVSYPTALKFIGDRIDLFKKVKRGVYEVRNVKEERAAGI